MYPRKLSEIFIRANYGPVPGIRAGTPQMQDENGYPWGFLDRYPNAESPTKILYTIGDSWLDSQYFNRVMANDYPNYIVINRAIGGANNSGIIDQLSRDSVLISSLDPTAQFVVSFSEVGRSIADFRLANPKQFTSTHDYFRAILERQFAQAAEILAGHDNYITTSFAPNPVNRNPSILAYCGEPASKEPAGAYTVFGTTIYEYLRDRYQLFNFNFADDVERSIKYSDWIESHHCIDDNLHPQGYSVYEQFIHDVFEQLNK